MTTTIIGYGWVGKAMEKLFPNSYIYDVTLKYSTKKESNKRDVAFVCVPTPNPDNGRLDTSIVEEVISWCESDLIVIRSTINPGDCDKWVKKYSKNIVFQPEYLGETPGHPLLNPNTRQFIIIGGNKKHTRKLIELYTTVYNANVSIRQVSLLEAEIIKLTENRAIAFKVAQCQELYDVCETKGIDYYTIRDAVYGDDPRFNLWWTFVYPERRGMNSKCIPKDVYAWCAWAETSPLTKSLLEINDQWISIDLKPINPTLEKTLTHKGD
jgi:UDP-glucose 6-dehydrogenase